MTAGPVTGSDREADMGVIEDLAGSLSGGPEAMQAPLAQAMTALIGAQEPGIGLESLLRRLRDAGLGSAVQSWVQAGPKQKIAPAQLRAALGQQDSIRMARDAGLSEEEFLGVLTEHLPAVVERLVGAGRLQGAG